MGRVTSIDADTVLTETVGITLFEFGAVAGISHIPSEAGWGTVLTFRSANQAFQLCSDSTNELWFRTADGNNIKSWRKLSFIG